MFFTGMLLSFLVVKVNPTPPEPQNLYDVEYPEEITQVSIDPKHPDIFTIYRVDSTNRLVLGFAHYEHIKPDGPRPAKYDADRD